jgi:transcriptional regulator with XRE-family HTH domain
MANTELAVPSAQLDVDKLHAALDAARRERGLSWRAVAHQAGVSPSTLTRLGDGKRPDVDGFAALVRWLGLPAERFFTGDENEAAQESMLAAISAYLHASKELTPEWAETIEAMIGTAYERALAHGGAETRRKK